MINKFNIGDKVKILGTGSSMSGQHIAGKYRRGAKDGDIVTITGITTEGGEATEVDPRYYGDNFNVRGHHLELVESVDCKLKLIPGNWYTTNDWTDGSYARFVEITANKQFRFSECISSGKYRDNGGSWSYYPKSTKEVPTSEILTLLEKYKPNKLATEFFAGRWYRWISADSDTVMLDRLWYVRARKYTNSSERYMYYDTKITKNGKVVNVDDYCFNEDLIEVPDSEIQKYLKVLEYNIKAGDTFKCHTDLVMNGSKAIQATSGKVYKSEYDGCFTNNTGDKNHAIRCEDFSRWFELIAPEQTDSEPTLYDPITFEAKPKNSPGDTGYIKGNWYKWVRNKPDSWAYDSQSLWAFKFDCTRHGNQYYYSERLNGDGSREVKDDWTAIKPEDCELASMNEVERIELEKVKPKPNRNDFRNKGHWVRILKSGRDSCISYSTGEFYQIEDDYSRDSFIRVKTKNGSTFQLSIDTHYHNGIECEYYGSIPPANVPSATLVAQDLVEVRPMDGPGKQYINFVDCVYDSKKPKLVTAVEQTPVTFSNKKKKKSFQLTIA